MLEIQNNKEFMSHRCDETMNDDYKVISKTLRVMEETLLGNDVNYLVASQLGLNERIIMVKYDDGEVHAFINPIVTDYSKKITMSREKDLFDNKEYLVPRKQIIEVTFTNKSGTFKKVIYKDGAAFLLQNLMDLLEGVFVSDIGLEVLDGWDEASDEEKQEVLNMYFDSLKKRQEELKKEIESDECLSYIDDTIKKVSEQFKEEDEQLKEQEKKSNRLQRRLSEKEYKKFQQRIKHEMKRVESMKDEDFGEVTEDDKKSN